MPSPTFLHLKPALINAKLFGSLPVKEGKRDHFVIHKKVSKKKFFSILN